jgi:hypothetical protein
VAAEQTSKDLRRVLRERVRGAVQAAADAPHRLTDAEVAELERLARLLAVDEGLRARSRWVVIAAVAAAVVVFMVLLALPLRTTEVDLELVAEEASFVVPERHVVIAATGVSALGVSGLRRFELPADPPRPALVLTAPAETDIAVRLSPDRSGGGVGAVDLGAVAVAATTRVWVRPGAGPRRHHLWLEPPPEALHADVQGRILLEAQGRPAERITVATAQQVRLEPGGRTVDLDLTLRDGTALVFLGRLPATDLAFSRVEEFEEPATTMVRRVSTVVSGRVAFADAPPREHRLHTGETLRLDGARGVIRALSVAEDGVHLEFHGRVHAVTTGWGDFERNITPTWVQYLQANQALSLLWGAVVSASALIVSLLRWWRAPS